MTKRVAVINDLSGFGKCSLTAAIPVLSVMGIQPCPMPTAILTNQSGFNNYKCVDFTDNMYSYIDLWKINGASFDGIYSGYIANIKQIDIISQFIDAFRTSSTAVIVDPVMADNGMTYKGYDSQMCEQLSALASKADYITPNLTELCILTNKNYSEVVDLEPDAMMNCIKSMATGLAEKNSQTVIVTGVPCGDLIYNCIFDSSSASFIPSKRFEGSFSGTGDLFASAFCGGVVKGLTVRQSVENAAAFLEKSISDTIILGKTDRNQGVEFEKNLKHII